MNDFISAVSAIGRNTWNVFKSVSVPGLGVSFAVMFSSLYLFRKLISLIKYLSGGYSNDDNNNKIYKKGA